MTINLVIFFCYLLSVASLLHFSNIKKLNKTDIKKIFMYSGTLEMIGPIGEVAINHYCRAAFNCPLWEYKVMPIYGGDTSELSFYMWALYGCHLYFVHSKLQAVKLKYEEYMFCLVMTIDAMLIEIFVNLSSMFLINSFMFYYLSGDIYHLTSVFVAPFYVFASFALNRSFKRFLNDPLFFGAMNFFIGFVFVFLH